MYEDDSVAYTVTANNQGSVALSNVSVEDTLPAGLIGGTWTCQSPVGSTAVCSGATGVMPLSVGVISLPAHARLIYAISATVDTVLAPAIITNTVTASSGTSGAQCWDGAVVTALPCAATADLTTNVRTAPAAVPAGGAFHDYFGFECDGGGSPAADIRDVQSFPSDFGPWFC